MKSNSFTDVASRSAEHPMGVVRPYDQARSNPADGMTRQKLKGTLDASILILHPACAPCVFHSGGALEFEEEGALVLPAQKQIKNSMIHVLNEFLSFRKTPAIGVESRLRVESRDGTEFPATYVVRLVGSGVTSAEVMVFRAAARFILNAFVPQRSLGDQETDHLLQETEKVFLRELGDGVAAKYAHKSITQGFVVRFGNVDPHGVTLQGIMPALDLEQRAYGTIEGFGRPMGFDEQKSTATLWFTRFANDHESSPDEGRLKILCHDLDFLRTIARAYANRNQLEFKALRQPEARKKKPVITLLELREVAANDLDQFELK